LAIPINPTAGYTTINIYAVVGLVADSLYWRLDGVWRVFRPLFG